MGTILVTGANRGIGLELCRQLVVSGEQVIAVCRRRSKELDAVGVSVATGIDVSSDKDVKDLARRLKGVRLDTVINNAGILESVQLEALDMKSMRNQFEINALGPLRITQALLPNLRSSAKVAIITSRMGSIADNTSGGSYGYRMSKAAVNMAGKSLSLDLHPKGIAVALIHPGYVKTDMTGFSGMIEASEAAAGILDRIRELDLNNTGTFWHMNGETLPW